MRNVLNCGQFLSSFMEVMQDQFVFYKCDVFYLVMHNIVNTKCGEVHSVAVKHAIFLYRI